MSKKRDPNRGGAEKRVRLSEDLLWGVHPVFEGLENEPKRFAEIILQKDRRGEKIEEIIRLARKERIKLTFVSSLKLTGEGSSRIRHQGIIAKISQTPLVPFDVLSSRLQKRIESKKICRLMVLDSLQDPHNIGAIIRSSLASGMDGILVTRERTAPLGGTAAKSSAGAMSHIDICQVTNLVQALQELKKIGFWVFGAVKDSEARSLYETDLAVPACLIVGSEGKGIRPLVKKECDVLISIPMEGGLDSLNSSVAAGVIAFEAMRQNIVSQSTE